MARTAVEVEAEIDKLKSLLSKGVLRVRHGDTETTYQNATEMRNYLSALEAELRALRQTSVKQIRFTTSKGL
jgi:hypothetical protein